MTRWSTKYKINTQTITSRYSRILITEMFASQWQQFFKQISTCKSPWRSENPPLGILIRSQRSPLWATTPLPLECLEPARGRNPDGWCM